MSGTPMNRCRGHRFRGTETPHHTEVFSCLFQTFLSECPKDVFILIPSKSDYEMPLTGGWVAEPGLLNHPFFPSFPLCLLRIPKISRTFATADRFAEKSRVRGKWGGMWWTYIKEAFTKRLFLDFLKLSQSFIGRQGQGSGRCPWICNVLHSADIPSGILLNTFIV